MKLVAEASIEIQAPMQRVWEVLVKPQYINQWDDMPDNYDYRNELAFGTQITWQQSADSFTRLTVVGMEPGKLFRLALYRSVWGNTVAPDAITYSYSITQESDKVKLSVAIGDFSILPDGEKYLNASKEFAEPALQKIKALALNDSV